MFEATRRAQTGESSTDMIEYPLLFVLNPPDQFLRYQYQDPIKWSFRAAVKPEEEEDPQALISKTRRILTKIPPFLPLLLVT